MAHSHRPRTTFRPARASRRRGLLLESLEPRRLLVASAASGVAEAMDIDRQPSQWISLDVAVRNESPMQVVLQAEGESAALSLAPSITGTVAGLPVSIDRHDAPGDNITIGETWLIAHGNASSPETNYIDELASAIHSASGGDQVLTLDWSSIAALFIGTTENNIIPVAEWASTALTAYGFSGANLNIVGHSFGAYVAGEMAERMDNGVDSLVGLDPAADWPFGYDPHGSEGVDFAAHSLFSWTFSDAGGPYGSSITPATADEAITVTNTTHSGVVSLFSNMLSGLGNQEVVQFFPLDRLQSHTPGPWIPDQFTNGGQVSSSGAYEAVITADGTGTVAESIDYRPLAAPPEVTVTSPNGGENWEVGSLHEISWTATDDQAVTTVDISYSITGPSGPFLTIATSESNDGSFSWVVPDSVSQNAFVRVLAFDTGGDSGDDVSDQAFIISATDTVAPDVTVIAPNGGETWDVGSDQTITWTADDNVGVASVDLEYSDDGGANFLTIATGEDNDGSYAWTVPNTPTESGIVRIIARDFAGNESNDTSDTEFTIASVSSQVRDVATGDLPVSGTYTGTYLDTQTSDTTFQVLTEEAYANRRSRLEHKWTFDVTGGDSVTFHLEGYSQTEDSDSFVVSYSVDDANYIDLLTLASTEQTYSMPLPNSLNGSVFVRVLDTNRGRSNNASLDSVHINAIYFESVSGPVTPVTDIAVTTVSAAPSAVQGQVVDVEVRLQNVGNQNVPSDIVVSLTTDNGTPGGENTVIGNQTVTGGLAAGAMATLSFAWDTSLAPLGDHTLTATHDYLDNDSGNDSGTTVVTLQKTQPPTESVIDDGDEGYSAPGYTGKSSAEAYSGDYQYARAGDGSLVASWTFASQPSGTYEVYATWVAHPKKHASNAPYAIYDGLAGDALLASVQVDQRQTPDSSGWQLLDTVIISGDTLTVTLNNQADGTVIADAVRIVPAAAATSSPLMVFPSNATNSIDSRSVVEGGSPIAVDPHRFESFTRTHLLTFDGWAVEWVVTVDANATRSPSLSAFKHPIEQGKRERSVLIDAVLAELGQRGMEEAWIDDAE